jgi:hypothetical protein
MVGFLFGLLQNNPKSLLSSRVVWLLFKYEDLTRLFVTTKGKRCRMRDQTQELVEQYKLPVSAIADYGGLPTARVSDYLKDRSISEELATKIEKAVYDLSCVRRWAPLVDVRNTEDMKALAAHLINMSPEQERRLIEALNLIDEIFGIQYPPEAA